MRRLFAVTAIVSLSLSPSFAIRAVDKAGDSPEALRLLVEQLGDRNFRVRMAAGRALEEKGEAVVPLLREAVGKTEDEEVRRRSEVLLQRIERAALLAPKRITMQMKKKPIEEVVRELARQTGYKIQYQGGQPRKITIEVENASYWKVLESLCDQGGLVPGFDDQQGIVYLYQQNTMSPYTYHNGPFRLVAQNFSFNRFLNLANIPRNSADPNAHHHDHNNLNFGFMIQSEPKIPILSIGMPRLTKAEDENGNSLLPRVDREENDFNEVNYLENNLHRNSQHSTSVAMAKPAKEATTARTIKGKVPVTLLTGTRIDLSIDLPAEKKKVSGVGQTGEIVIEDISEQGGTWNLTLLIKRQARNNEQRDFNWVNNVHQRLELHDAKGRKFHSQGVGNFIDNSENSVHAVYQFSDPGKFGPAKKLVLTEWLTMSHELEFEFKDLPLP